MKQGLIIKIKRMEKGLRQYEFANEIGISREYLRKLENGTAKNPSIKVMKKISEVLDVSPIDLFFLD